MLSRYIQSAMAQAVYERTEENKYWGEIPSCPGVNAYMDTLYSCQKQLQEVLEEWILLKLSKGDELPFIDKINLNTFNKT